MFWAMTHICISPPTQRPPTAHLSTHNHQRAAQASDRRPARLERGPCCLADKARVDQHCGGHTDCRYYYVVELIKTR